MRTVKDFKEKVKNTKHYKFRSKRGNEYTIYKISKRSLNFIDSFEKTIVFLNVDLSKALDTKIMSIINYSNKISLLCEVVESDLDFERGSVI